MNVFLLALVLATSAQGPADILIQGRTVVTMDDHRRVLEGGSVAIRGYRIKAILSATDPLPDAVETIDASGHLVIPGLVNTHGHAAMTLLRGIADDLALMEWLQNYIFPAEAHNVAPELVYWGTLLGCVEMARGGTAIYADVYYFEEEVGSATVAVGIHGVLGQSVIGFPAPDYKTPEEAQRPCRSLRTLIATRRYRHLAPARLTLKDSAPDWSGTSHRSRERTTSFA